MPQKNPKIFISHSSQDVEYVSHLVELLEVIGLTKDQLFCSSVPGYKIPLGEYIYDYLKQQFQLYNLHVVFVLSNNYYRSAACLNEMGAAWILQTKYTTILLPGFTFKEIEGAINPRQIGLKLDEDIDNVKERLNQLRDDLTQEFKLLQIPYIRWEQKRDNFINIISKLNQTLSMDISNEALNLLQVACDTDDGTILKVAYLSGTNIEIGGINFIKTQERYEIAKWEAALEELLNKGFIQTRGTKGITFVVSKSGYDYIKQL